MPRLQVTLTVGERSELGRRAAAHGLTLAGFLRRAALGTVEGPVQTPDAWWDTLPPSRRAQVHGWLTKPDDPGPGFDTPLPLDLTGSASPAHHRKADPS